MTSPRVRSLRKCRGLRVAHVGERTEAVDVADRVKAFGRHAGQSGSFYARSTEALMADEDLRLAVRQDVRDLGPDKVMVDRNEVPTRLQRREVELDDLDAVRQNGGDGVAHADAGCPEAVNDLIHPSEQASGRVLGAVRQDRAPNGQVRLVPMPRSRGRPSCASDR